MKRTVKGMANAIISSKIESIVCYSVVEHQGVDFYPSFSRYTNVITLDNGIEIEFMPDNRLRSGYRFYSPLRSLLLEEDEYINAEYDSEFDGEEEVIAKALKDWAFAWKEGAFTGDAYTRGTGNTRYRAIRKIR